jgi:hypothetical protein
MGDWQARVIEDLAAMLEIHANAVRFAQQVESGGEPPALVGSLSAFIEAGAKWLDRTGYHNRGPITHDAFRKPVAEALAKLANGMGREAMTDKVINPAIAAAERTCKPEACKLVVDSVLPK